MRNLGLYIFITIMLFSCATVDKKIVQIEEPVIDIIDTETKIETEEPIIEKIYTQDELDTIKIDDLISTLSLEEKIGQLFIFQIRGYTKADEKLKLFIEKYKPGGIILFSNNIENNDQVFDLISDLQSFSNIPMFISVDEEGGIVSRLGKEKNVNVTHLPPALEIGNRNDVVLAYNSGKILGSELFSLGFNMDMAPVADVNTNPKNPVIGNRTFSANQHTVGEMVVNFIKGLKEESVIPVMKHFPGHGDTTTDSHFGVTISPHNRERLDQIEFVPFIRGIEAGADVIMTAHINMPGLTTVPLPATLNPEIITGILRNDLGFKGIIMTDAMDMGAITNSYSTKVASLLAIKAGIDIILIPNNQQLAFEEVLDSVIKNELNEDRINESLKRILLLKLKSGILDHKRSNVTLKDLITDEKHMELIKTIK